ncbi:hypothetical protein B5S31_g3968 [[Candida] boidinii]|nr:hypothetical protein B5S31_g3968 [[Candida] boidinii]
MSENTTSLPRNIDHINNNNINMDRSVAGSLSSTNSDLSNLGNINSNMNAVNESSSALLTSRNSINLDLDRDVDMDPETDNEQHARRLLLKSKARSSSIVAQQHQQQLLQSKSMIGKNSFLYKEINGSYNNIISNSNNNNNNNNNDTMNLLTRFGYFYDQSQGPIANLPPEVLYLIFSYLSSKSDLLSVILTCKHWGDLIIDLIWFRPGIQNKDIFNQLKKVMEIPRDSTVWNYRQYIKRLNLSLVPHLVTDKYLDLFNGAINLERITLVNCSHITNKHISNLLKGCHRLQSIDLTGVRDIEDDIYLELAENCKRLQGLYAPGSSKVTKPAVLSLIENCPLLKRVKFSDCTDIDDEVVIKLAHSCPNLVEIDLHGCEKVTNVSLYELFSSLEFLKEFKISKNSNINYEFLETKNGTELCLDKLRILDFTSCINITDKAVEKLVKLAPRLRNVVLSKCSNITDASLRAIATLGKNLHYVHLGHCGNITDFGAKELIKSCHRLQYIDLACCSQLTDDTVTELALLPKLRRIGLVKCAQITDVGILALAASVGNSDDTLERVHLSYCLNLTVGPIYKLLIACPKLTHISLTGISQFLRPDITQFCREPPQEFNPHQKSIFCVFSGDGVTKLRKHLITLFEHGPQHNALIAQEISDVISSVINSVELQPNEGSDLTDVSDPIQRERRILFMQSLSSFIGELHQIDITPEQINTFCRAIFTRIPDELVPRVQRFLQRVHEYQISTQNQQTQQMRRNAEPNPNVQNDTQTQQQQQQQQRPQRQQPPPQQQQQQQVFLREVQQPPVNRQHRRQQQLPQQQQQLQPGQDGNLVRQPDVPIIDDEFWSEREFTTNDAALGINGPIITFRQLMAILQRNNIPVSPENARRLVESIRRNEITVQELLDPNINIGNRRINITQSSNLTAQQTTQQQQPVIQGTGFPATETQTGINNAGRMAMEIPDDGAADIDSDEPMED